MKQKIKDNFNGRYESFYTKYLNTVKKIGGDEFSAICPFHDDKLPSFNFNSGTGQYYCHGCGKKGDSIHFYAKLNGMDTRRDFGRVLKGIANDFGIPWVPQKKKTVAQYVYNDETGKPLHRTCRTEPKNFYQQHYDNGSWKSGLKGISPVIYQLPIVMKANEVLIVEGEKDCDNLAKLGFVASTCPMGAKKWRDHYNHWLKEKKIVLIPDNDNEGRDHMAKVGGSLNGSVASLKLLNLPNLPSKGDVSDFIASFSDPDTAAEKLSILIDQADQYHPSENLEPARDDFERGIITFDEFAKLEMPPKQVFLDPWIQEQSITLLSGWRGTGKTWLALSILNAISKGQPFGPWETENSVPCLYLDGEMPQQDMQYRAKELKINQNFKNPLYLYSDAYRTSLGLSRANLLDEDWREQMTKVLIDRGIKLWVIDNIASLAPGINENAKEDWDPINTWLLELRFAGVASILLHHVGKAGSQRGTSAREDNIDTSIVLKQPDNYQSDEGCRFIMQFKKNRVVSGDHFLIADQEFKYAHGKWQYENPKAKKKYRVWQMLNEGIPQNKIAEELKLSKSRVSQIRRKGIDGGYLSRNGKLTPFGRDKLDKN